MKDNLQVALVVPNYQFAWNDERQFHVSDLQRACHAGEIDLVIFPEAYECVEGTDAQQTVDEWATFLRTPVLMGVESSGFQMAVYRNPSPEQGDTQTHIYVKHSTARALAYEWPGYQGASDPMFRPILLKGERLGVQICHDMFYGLIGQRLIRAGARVLVDLTEGNVQLAKWRNIVQARSLEHQGLFLCTMGYTPDKNGAAEALIYRNGSPVTPLVDTSQVHDGGGYVVFSLRPQTENGCVEDNQASTEMFYTDITLALGTGKPADVRVSFEGGEAQVVGPRHCDGWGNWRCFVTEAGRVGVLPLPLAGLSDGTLVHRFDAPEGMFDHHVLLYHADQSLASPEMVMSLMKVRAIEHRAAIAILTRDNREVVTTTGYKNIQRLSEKNGVFGLKGRFLGGTWSTARDDQGIPRHWFPSYLALLQSDPPPTT